MAKAQPQFEKYGIKWHDGTQPLQIEFYCIRNYLAWGLDLFTHYKNAQKLLWPDMDHHRWSDLILKTILEERITMIAGPKDCGKTSCGLARFGLTDYWSDPDHTLVIVSSTELRGLELRVFGEIKQLFTDAKEKHPWLPGKVVDHMHGVFTDDLGENCDVRDIRKGIMCIPCVGSSGQWQGIGKVVGIKQKRRRLLADELGFMQGSYISSAEHMDKGDFKLVGCFNPIGQGDPADKMSEPIGGWGTEPQTDKTETWRNKWGGITINLDGRDSPNNDEPKGRYPYLISAEDIERTAKRCGMDSMEYWTQVVGKRKPGLLAHRVLTTQMCEMFGAFKPVIWQGKPTTKIYGIDASYGGDRCVGGSIEFGEDTKGQIVISFNPPVIIPIKVGVDKIPEDQIAEFVRAHCEAESIPPENVFYDATGRGSLGTSFGRLWSAMVNPVEFGGNPTTRPVSHDMYIMDDSTGGRRLKRCDEHYSKRVTEFWFSVRYLVESRQARNFPKDTADEFGMREWYMVRGDRRELEAKDETKKRMGCSPDLADWACVAVEGARRRGFQIQRMSKDDPDSNNLDWLERELNKNRLFEKSRQLNYSA